jgi:hypothetical protein
LFECRSISLNFISASVRSKGLCHLDSTPAVLLGRRQAGYMITVRHEVACRSCSHFNGGDHQCHLVNL